MTETAQLLSAEEQDLLTEVIRWATLHRLGPAQTADALVRVTRSIQMAILHLNEASAICAKHQADVSS
jgi:hypothetical protein